MAVIAIHKNTKVRMALNAGLDDNNKQITKYKTKFLYQTPKNIDNFLTFESIY